MRFLCLCLTFYDACGFQVVPQADRVLVRLEELPEVSLHLAKMANEFEVFVTRISCLMD